MNPKLIAFDLDGTLTQHRTPLGEENRRVLERLQNKYRLLMVGAGACMRIHNQMGGFPLDILGNYGMQFAEYDFAAGELVIRRSEQAAVDVAEVTRRAGALREKYGLHDFKGETIEIHATGMLTFPVLGTKADIADKLAYDPDKAKRKVMYPFVCELFHDYHVMIGGSSSFDIVPKQYGKLNALTRFMEEHGLTRDDVVYCGDDYRLGGNDYDVYEGGIPFVKVDDYTQLGETLRAAGLLP